ncbi:MAG: right-handed parallel beta-helix repeat-containing protein [Actinomycetota bacterium]|nr:right-handed parallel beta-helix repeat-containing protein [Actinomycetota bacterium]
MVTDTTTPISGEESGATPGQPLLSVVGGGAGGDLAGTFPNPTVLGLSVLKDAVLNVKDARFGAVGNGVADDTVAIQAAITAAGSAGGGVVFFPRGTYKISATLTLGANVTLKGSGNGSTLDFSAVTGTFEAVKAAGTFGTPVALTANAALNAETVAAPSAGFADGDWVKVYSDALTGSTSLKNGEQARIGSAAAMSLHDPLVDAYTTANLAALAKVNHVVGVTITDLRFLGPADNTLLITGVRVDLGRTVQVRNCTFERCHYYGVILADTVSSRVSGCHFGDNAKAGLGYGIAISQTSQDITMENCVGIRMRHLVTHGGTTGSAPAARGVPRRTVTIGCVASQMIDAGFDAHPGAEDISFIGNTVMGSEQDGISFQASSGVISGNTVRNCARHGIIVQHLTARALRVAVTGNLVTQCVTNGINVSTSSAWPLFSQAVIGDNAIDTVASGIVVSGGGATHVSVTGNTIRRASTSHGILVDSLSYSTVADNTVECQGTGISGIYARAFTDGSITGNVIRHSLTTSTVGVRVGVNAAAVASGDVVVTGNRCALGATGISIESTTLNAVVMSNNVRGNTTPLFMGTGTGHISSTTDNAGAYNRT